MGEWEKAGVQGWHMPTSVASLLLPEPLSRRVPEHVLQLEMGLQALHVSDSFLHGITPVVITYSSVRSLSLMSPRDSKFYENRVR